MTRVVACLLLLIGLLAVAGLAVGEQRLALADIFAALTADPDTPAQSLLIVREFRLPRVLAALLVGLALAVSGALTQTAMRNPLAEPGLLGINSGAALAALVTLVVLRVNSAQAVALAAFFGAVFAASAVYLLSWKNGARSIRIILIGIGVSAMCGAGASMITVFGDVTAVQQAQMWLAGTLFFSDWQRVNLLTAVLVPVLGASMILSRELDLALFSEDVSASLGQRGQRVQVAALSLCVVMSALAVSAAGLIGFVGLAAPHAARALVGQRHAHFVPVAALAGAALVLAADIIARTVLAPAQLPAGLVTSLLGAPAFFWVFWKMRHAAI